MNPVAQGLALGYSAQKLIGFLTKAFPQLAPRVRQAQRNGHTVEQVLGFLSKTMETDLPKGTSQQEVLAATNKNKEQLTKHGLTLAASALAAPLAANAARSVLARALPQTLAPQAAPLANASNTPNPASTVPQQTSPSPTATNPTIQQSQNTSPQPPNPISPNVPNAQQGSQQPPLSNANAASIPEPANINQSKGFDTNIIKNSLAYKKQIDALVNNGNGPEQIEAYLKTFNPQFIKTIEKEGKGAFKDIVGQYIQEKTQEDALQPEGSISNVQAAPIQEQPQLQEAETLQETIQEPEKPKIEKNSVVSSPNGIGEVKEIRNGQAIVEVDGKLTKVKEEDLHPEPEEVKKAKIEFNLDDVDESLRSAPLNEIYAPAHRKHVTIKYNSDIGKDKSKRYIFFKKDGSPVDENLIENLRKGSQLPMTSGKTFWGGWSADTQDSRGTVAYHELTKLAQKEGEEDDPSKPYWFEEEEEVFTHGYSKMGEKKLLEEKKKFDAEEKRLNAEKKPKKKRA